MVLDYVTTAQFISLDLYEWTYSLFLLYDYYKRKKPCNEPSHISYMQGFFKPLEYII